ncbi:glucokinase [Paenibacillus taihuensis]|uniref:Glucokinase n=1 Tax=Paenibacillus taihuensis TaxID=1156355 RepID=A0A3D9R0G4_9BACL|nr:ROK family protein [Paenibacillus taihuensis]REE67322.1 glucokinase [Paenibacillus taihuensis]
MRESRHAIGVDIGGTKINIGLIDFRGHILRDITVPTMAKERRVMAQTIDGIRALLSESEAEADNAIPCGIGVGSAGQIDFETGTVISATDLLPEYAGTPIRAILEQCFGMPVYVDNDVNVLALSELYLSKEERLRDFICVALGTGVGGGVVTDGHLVRGVQGIGGEIGHISVDFRGPVCMCGGIGCLELYTSGTSIARRMGEKRGRLEACVEWSCREVVEQWLRGDTAATEVMEETIEALSAGLAGLIHTFNPAKIVIGGGVADAGEPLFTRLRLETYKRTMPAYCDATRIEPPLFGTRSGMIGAAIQVFRYGGAKQAENELRLKGRLIPWH